MRVKLEPSFWDAARRINARMAALAILCDPQFALRHLPICRLEAPAVAKHPCGHARWRLPFGDAVTKIRARTTRHVRQANSNQRSGTDQISTTTFMI